MSDAPKSALDLVLERLRKKDAESGITEKPLTDAQRAAIAEARSVYEARVAERKIMHKSAMRTTGDPAAREALEEELRRDLERFESERESKVRKIRETA
jgi:CRISPR/Cas system-associated endonuclease Cas3-HD